MRRIGRVFQIIGFLGWFAWEIFRANLRVAFDVITPEHYMHPGIVAVPLDAKTDLEITFLGAVISLTPGSLVLDVSSDRKVMFVHAMYLTDIDEFKDAESRLLKVMR